MLHTISIQILFGQQKKNKKILIKMKKSDFRIIFFSIFAGLLINSSNLFFFNI